MELLETRDLTKQYGKGTNQVTALDHVNLGVQKGEFVAIIGSSGSGKSTLLHMLGGVDRPDSGQILVEGFDIGSMKETELAVFRRRKVGLIYQFYNLVPTLDIRKNMLLPMLLDGAKPDIERLNELAQALGLTNRLHHLPSELSGGQQQRAAIGRALIYRPAILLADEPTGNLDRQNSKEIMELLKLSNIKYHQTIVLITHDEELALEAERILRLEDGKIVSDSAEK
jgi:putative ABC transport system ATP-binding protein